MWTPIWRAKNAVTELCGIGRDCRLIWEQMTWHKQRVGWRRKWRWLLRDACAYGGESLVVFFALMCGRELRLDDTVFEAETDDGSRRIITIWMNEQNIRIRKQGQLIELRKQGCVRLFCPAEMGQVDICEEPCVRDCGVEGGP